MDDDTIEIYVGNTSSALDKILDQEFEESILKYSSFLCIIHDKYLTNIAIFTLIMKDLHIRRAFKQLTQIDNDRTLVLQFLKYYPNFCKSKVVKRLIQQYVK